MTDTKLGYSLPTMYWCEDCLPEGMQGDDPIRTDEAEGGYCICETCGATLHGEDPA